MNTNLGHPQFADVILRPNDDTLCIDPITAPGSFWVSEGSFLVLADNKAVASIELIGDGRACGIGKRGYNFRTIRGQMPPSGVDALVGPLKWELTGNESYVRVGEPNAFGLGPIDVLLLDLDGDMTADFKVIMHSIEGCLYYWALTRNGNSWEWRASSEGAVHCI